MSINKILEYQKIDLEFYSLENELRNCPAAKEVSKYSQIKQNAMKEISKVNSYTEDLFKNFERYNATYEKLSKEIEDLTSIISSETDEKETEFYSHKLSKIFSELENVEEEISKMQRKLNTAQEVGKKEYKNASTAHSLYNKSLTEFNVFKENLQNKATPLIKTLGALKKDISPELLDIYKRLRDNKKMPAFVAFGNTSSCTGCGMELSNDKFEQLKGGNKEYVDCPNCGRIIYILK